MSIAKQIRELRRAAASLGEMIGDLQQRVAAIAAAALGDDLDSDRDVEAEVCLSDFLHDAETKVRSNSSGKFVVVRLSFHRNLTGELDSFVHGFSACGESITKVDWMPGIANAIRMRYEEAARVLRYLNERKTPKGFRKAIITTYKRLMVEKDTTAIPEKTATGLYVIQKTSRTSGDPALYVKAISGNGDGKWYWTKHRNKAQKFSRSQAYVLVDQVPQEPGYRTPVVRAAQSKRDVL